MRKKPDRALGLSSPSSVGPLGLAPLTLMLPSLVDLDLDASGRRPRSSSPWSPSSHLAAVVLAKGLRVVALFLLYDLLKFVHLVPGMWIVQIT